MLASRLVWQLFSRIQTCMETDTRIDALDREFSIPGVARIVRGNGNLPKILIDTKAATAEIYLYGAQVTSWRPAGADEVLFVSEKSYWEAGRAIRGGIPVCFPWFRAKADDKSAPSHGFVRTKEWRVDSISAEDEDSYAFAFPPRAMNRRGAGGRLIFVLNIGSPLARPCGLNW